MEFTIVYDKATKDVKINGVEFQYETAKKLTTQKFNQVLSRMGGCVEISRKDDKTTKLLTTISFPAKLKSIGSWAFSGCQLQTIEFAEGGKLTEIGERAFKGVPISTLTIPKGVKKLDSWAFADCKNLKTVVLPEGIELFDRFEIFGGCEALETINIPASLTNLGYKAFKGCTSLKNITVDPDNPSYVMKDGKLMTKDLQEQVFPVVD